MKYTLVGARISRHFDRVYPVQPGTKSRRVVPARGVLVFEAVKMIKRQDRGRQVGPVSKDKRIYSGSQLIGEARLVRPPQQLTTARMLTLIVAFQ